MDIITLVMAKSESVTGTEQKEVAGEVLASVYVDYGYYETNSEKLPLKVGEKYLVARGNNVETVIYDGAVLKLTDGSVLDNSTEAGWFFIGGTDSFHLTVSTVETIHPIDPKYIPDTVATKADIFGAMEGSY